MPCGGRRRCLPHVLVEDLEGKVFDEGYAVDLYTVDLDAELHATVLLDAHYVS